MWFIWNRSGVLRSLVNCLHLFGWHRHWLNLAEKIFSQILRFAGLYTGGSDGPTRDQAKASFCFRLVTNFFLVLQSRKRMAEPHPW